MKKNKNIATTNRRQAERGHQKAAVFSYYNNRSPSPQNTGRLKETGKRFSWQLVPSLLAVLVIVVSLLYATTLSSRAMLRFPKNNTLSIIQPPAVYQAAVNKRLSASLLNRSKFLIDTKAIEAQLLAQFPELQSLGITVPLTARQPIVSIKPAEPRLLLRASGSIYAIDASGKALLKVTDTALADKLHLPMVTDQTGLAIKTGKVVLAEREVTFIREVDHQLTSKGVDVESLTLPPLADELHLKPRNSSYYVKFNMLEDPRLQAGRYLALKSKLDADHMTPAEYIDVRVDEKVFYK